MKNILLIFFVIFTFSANAFAYQAKKKHYIDFKDARNRTTEYDDKKEKTYPKNKIWQKNIEESITQEEAVGTKIALKDELKRYSRELELYFLSSMWKFAYFSSKDKDNKGIGDTLYADQYIAKMVEQAYGENGGQLADSMYKKLMLEQGLELDE